MSDAEGEMRRFFGLRDDPWCHAPPWAIALRDEVRKTRRALGVLTEEVKMAEKTLDDVLADVTDESTQIDSLSTLTAGIKAQLDAITAGSLTPAQQQKVDAVFAAVDANKAKVVTAINANTAAASVPVPAV